MLDVVVEGLVCRLNLGSLVVVEGLGIIHDCLYICTDVATLDDVRQHKPVFLEA